MKTFIIICFCTLFHNAFCQELDAISVKFRDCIVNGNLIDSLNNEDFEFSIHYKKKLIDTLKLRVVHHRGQSLLSNFKYSFATTPDYSLRLKLYEIKPGDQISFFFTMRGSIIQKTFIINSTINSLTKPYFIDIYFVYNNDTIATNQFVIHNDLQNEKRESFVRMFYNDPKELPNKLRVDFNNIIFFYQFDWPAISSLFRGRVTLEYFDKKDFEDSFNKRINLVDLDTGREFKQGEIFIR